MPDRLSPVEIRTRARRWRHDARVPRENHAASRGARAEAEGPIVIERSPAEPALGPSARGYDLSEGYTTERIILRP